MWILASKMAQCSFRRPALASDTRRRRLNGAFAPPPMSGPLLLGPAVPISLFLLLDSRLLFVVRTIIVFVHFSSGQIIHLSQSGKGPDASKNTSQVDGRGAHCAALINVRARSSRGRLMPPSLWVGGVAATGTMPP